MAERIIRAAVAQDYPHDRLHIQILDDSTDDTSQIAQQIVTQARRKGVAIDHIRRAERCGYKAGALAAALPLAKGEFIAIFDADFLPDPGFLRRILLDRRSFDDPCVGFVQTRWDFLNRDVSVLTRAQAMTLDVHFIIEQPGRNKAGLFMNFNGSGGIWRRGCICDAGGWASDTLTEDLDLSYRAEIRGWRGVYLEDEAAPGELPVDVMAYKRQQARWARGTWQTVRKLIPSILRASFPLKIKLAAWMHLTGYFIHPLILLMTLTTPLLIGASLLGPRLGPQQTSVPMWVNLISVLSIAPMVSMYVAHRARGRTFWQFVRDLPEALMLGVGVSFSNTIAMASALFDKRTGHFLRTPKPGRNVAGHNPGQGAAGAASVTRRKQFQYRLRPDWTMWCELGLSLYTAAALAVILHAGMWASVGPLALYALGFGGVGLTQLSAFFTQYQDRIGS